MKEMKAASKSHVDSEPRNPEKRSFKERTKQSVTRMSPSVDMIGYTIMSGSNPCLNERIEIPIVTGETRNRDRPIVVNIAENMLRDSIACVPHNDTFMK